VADGSAQGPLPVIQRFMHQIFRFWVACCRQSLAPCSWSERVGVLRTKSTRRRTSRERASSDSARENSKSPLLKT